MSIHENSGAIKLEQIFTQYETQVRKLQIQACTIVLKDFCRTALGRNLRFNNFTIFVLSISQPNPADVSDLRRELEDTKLRLFEKQRELNEERATMKRRQLEVEEKLRREQDSKDKELRSVYERLANVEQQLRDQQTEMEGTLKAKNVIIQAQEQRIKSLNTDYNKLLEALNQLQKTPSVKSMNIRITDNL